jgi:hypothetical protein
MGCYSEEVMIRVLVAFPTMGSCCTRWVNSIRKYLPDDVVISDVIAPYKKYNGREFDVVITHKGAMNFSPLMAVVSPKIVLTEDTSVDFLSYFTEKDLLVSYQNNNGDVYSNALFIPRPADKEIFYPETTDKIYDAISLDHHGDWGIRADAVLRDLGMSHVALLDNYQRLGKDTTATLDYCWIGRDDDKMRRYYCQSKYVMSFLEEYEYAPGKWSVGWEAGNVEGLMCGARPICLKSEHTSYFEQALGKYVIYIDKNNFESELRKILVGEYKKVSLEESQQVTDMVDASVLWPKMWDRVREILNV